MNLSPRWIELFAQSGIEAVHWSGVGRANATDAEIMAFAAAQEYVVLTHDLDFGAILAATQEKTPSVVQLRAADVSPDVIGRRLISLLHQQRHELERGALVSVDAARNRVRLLPLPPPS
jgi:predicted nuclease of predicted toxin-antitoxin system